MKKLLCISCGLLVATVGVRAAALFSDNFDGYVNGDVVLCYLAENTFNLIGHAMA